MKCLQLTFLKNFCLSCELVHDDGDGVVVIMCVNGRCDGCDHDRSTGESKDHREGRALCVGRGDC